MAVSVKCLQHHNCILVIHNNWIITIGLSWKIFGAAGKLCPKDLRLMRNWKFSEKFKSGNLTSLGRQELFTLGKRFKRAFPELLQIDPANIKPEDYLVSLKSKSSI